MNTKAQFERGLEKNGNTVLLVLQGSVTACPCTDNSYHDYDPEWHNAHPAEPDCGGTGYLDQAVETPSKAFVIPAKDAESQMVVAGELSSDDQVFMSYSDIDIENLSEIQYQGNRYKLKDPDHYIVADEKICLYGVLELIAYGDEKN